MNDDLNPIEEQAIDALLGETLGNAGPPDLSNQITARYLIHTGTTQVLTGRADEEGHS